MYRYGNGQISLSDFQQPMGMCLREDNMKRSPFRLDQCHECSFIIKTMNRGNIQ